MADDSPKTPDTLECPICRRPLKRTSDRVLSALECSVCGEFPDFSAGRARPSGGGQDDSGSGPTG